MVGQHHLVKSGHVMHDEKIVCWRSRKEDPISRRDPETPSNNNRQTEVTFGSELAPTLPATADHRDGRFRQLDRYRLTRTPPEQLHKMLARDTTPTVDRRNLMFQRRFTRQVPQTHHRKRLHDRQGPLNRRRNHGLEQPAASIPKRIVNTQNGLPTNLAISCRRELSSSAQLCRLSFNRCRVYLTTGQNTKPAGSHCQGYSTSGQVISPSLSDGGWAHKCSAESVVDLDTIRVST